MCNVFPQVPPPFFFFFFSSSSFRPPRTARVSAKVRGPRERGPRGRLPRGRAAPTLGVGLGEARGGGGPPRGGRRRSCAHSQFWSRISGFIRGGLTSRVSPRGPSKLSRESKARRFSGSGSGLRCRSQRDYSFSLSLLTLFFCVNALIHSLIQCVDPCVDPCADPEHFLLSPAFSGTALSLPSLGNATVEELR